VTPEVRNEFSASKGENELCTEMKFSGYADGHWPGTLKEIALQLNRHSIPPRADAIASPPTGSGPGFCRPNWKSASKNRLNGEHERSAGRQAGGGSLSESCTSGFKSSPRHQAKCMILIRKAIRRFSAKVGILELFLAGSAALEPALADRKFCRS